jgi:Tat protein secretion system quality control protein TatD with DNase activity
MWPGLLPRIPRQVLSDPLVQVRAGDECQDSHNAPHRSQVALALKYQKPLYLHVREAFEDTIRVLEEELTKHLSSSSSSPALGDSPAPPPPLISSGGSCLTSWTDHCPPCVVHCFTGTLSELQAYISFGWYIGLTGSIMSLSDKELHSHLTLIPLDRLVIETDSPYLGWKGCRRSEHSKKSAKYPNVPSALPQILEKIVTALEGRLSATELTRLTTQNAFEFCKIKDMKPY